MLATGRLQVSMSHPAQQHIIGAKQKVNNKQQPSQYSPGRRRHTISRIPALVVEKGKESIEY
jgi:hypothetical protein